MREFVRSILRSKAEKAEHKGGKSATLFSMLPVAYIGPLCTFVAGLLLVSNPTPTGAGLCLLSVFALLYLGGSMFLYTRICRITSFQLVGAIGTTIVSFTGLLAVLRPFIVDGLDKHLGSLVLLGISYLVVLVFAFHQAKKGLRKFLAGPLAERCIDFEKGIYDYALASKPWRNLASRPMEYVPELQETRTWTWILSGGVFLAPVFSALLIVFFDDLSQSGQIFILILFSYGFAIFFGFLAPRPWLNYWWYRTWEQENGKPMLIKYLEDRYKGAK